MTSDRTLLMILIDENQIVVLTDLIYHGKFDGESQKITTQGNAQALHGIGRTIELNRKRGRRSRRRDWGSSQDSRVICSSTSVIRGRSG